MSDAASSNSHSYDSDSLSVAQNDTTNYSMSDAPFSNSHSQDPDLLFVNRNDTVQRDWHTENAAYLSLVQSAANGGDCATCNTLRVIMKNTDERINALRKKVKKYEDVILSLESKIEEATSYDPLKKSTETENEILQHANRELTNQINAVNEDRDRYRRLFESMYSENEMLNKKNMLQEMKLSELRGEAKVCLNEKETLKQELKHEQRENAGLYALINLTQL